MVERDTPLRAVIPRCVCVCVDSPKKELKVGEQLRIMIREDKNWRAVRFAATRNEVEKMQDSGGRGGRYAKLFGRFGLFWTKSKVKTHF